MSKRTIKRALIGFVIGMAIGDLIALFFAWTSHKTTIVSTEMINRFGSEAAAFLVHTLLSGIHGAICMAGVSLYEREDWGLLKTAVVHYLLIICSFTLIGSYLHWFSFSFADIAVSWTCMGIAYLIIWLIMHFRYKAEVNELNEMLKKEKEE